MNFFWPIIKNQDFDSVFAGLYLHPCGGCVMLWFRVVDARCLLHQCLMIRMYDYYPFYSLFGIAACNLFKFWSCCSGLLFNMSWQHHCLLLLRSFSFYILKINMVFFPTILLILFNQRVYMNGLFPSLADVDLTFVFLPLLAFEVAILVVNLRYFINVLRFWFCNLDFCP